MPNPSGYSSSIGFTLAEPSGYTLVLHNILGEEVEILAENRGTQPGTGSISFSTSHLETGIYFITFTCNGFRQTRKLVVSR